LRLLRLLRQSFEHPLGDLVLDVVETRIRGGSIGVDDALAMHRQVEPHPNQYCAMNIVCFACDEDAGGVLEVECDRIGRRWQSA
jgi:hypothetical protein